MAKKYHIREGGTLGVCTAQPGACPISSTELGEPYHGTRKEVSAEIKRRFQEIYGPSGLGLPSFASSSVSPSSYGPLGLGLPEGVMTVNEYGDKEWYLNDKLHRIEGPAIERANGDKEWHLNGEELSEAGFKTRMRIIKRGRLYH